ncbi:MAG: hypothetical protein NHB15_16865 [Methanosarcina barkeri]|nr:hypothetical protein [Methanosarcina sp. ERenArc_MAG2]
MGIQVHKALTTGYSLSELIEGKTDLTENNPKVPEEKARKWALSIAGVFGKLRENSDKDTNENSSQSDVGETTNSEDSEKSKKGKSKKGNQKRTKYAASGTVSPF